ncbi:hypothetical protein Tco_1077488, partial [Tanacetum coccineum]
MVEPEKPKKKKDQIEYDADVAQRLQAELDEEARLEREREEEAMHHESTKKGIDIYMLVEKEYPLLRGTLTLMLVAKLLVDQDNEMSKELLRKIFMQ